MKLPEICIKLKDIIIEVVHCYKEANRDPDLPELSLKQFYYLDVINKMNKPTFSELAEEFKVTKPAVTAIVKKLINLGYLERLQSNEDRRVYYILVSDKGKRLIEFDNNAYNEFAKFVEASLSEDELEKHIQITKKIIAAYKSKRS